MRRATPLVLALALIGCRRGVIGLESDSEIDSDTDPIVDPDTDPGTDPDTDTDPDTALDPQVGAIEGTVLLPDGEPAEGALVAVDGRADVADAAGAFAFDEVSLGLQALRAELSGYLPAAAEVDVIAGETVSLTLTLGEPAGVAPIVSALSATPLPVPRGGEASLIAVAADPDGDPLTWAWTATGDFTVADDGAGLATLTAPDRPDARGQVTVTVTDADGDQGSATLAVSTAANAAPTLSSVVATPVPADPAGAIAVRATVADADDAASALSWSWVAPRGWSLVGTGPSVTLTAPDGFGLSGLVDVSVTDPWGAVAEGSVAVSTRANQPPVLGSVTASPDLVARGGVATLAVQATDPDARGLSYQWSAPNGWSLPVTDAAEVRATAPNAPAQSGTFTVRVTDRDGASVDGSVVVRTRANAAPVIEGLVAQPNPAEPSGAIGLRARAVDPEGDALTYAWSAPRGWTLSEAGASATLTAPAERGATGVVGLVVTDAFGATARGELAVSTAPNLVPVIASVIASPSRALPGERVRLSVDASDPNGDPLVARWALPRGWTLEQDGVEAVAVVGAATGQQLVGVTVADPYGGSAEGTVAVEVGLDNQPPTITWPRVLPFAPGGVARIVPLVEDPDGDRLSYAWTSVEPGWTVTDGAAFTTVTAPLPGPGFSASTTLRLEVSDGAHVVSATLPLAIAVAGADCVEALAAGVPAGPMWLAPGGDLSRAFATACEPAQGGGEPWMLVYKRSAGVARADLPADFASGNLNPYDLELLDRDREDRDFSGRPIASAWGAHTEARVEVVVGGAVAQWMRYDTHGSTPATFFAEDRLLASSWSGISSLHVGDGEYWSTAGYAALERRWYLNRRWGGCANDEGWLLVQGDATGGCSFDRDHQILYSTSTGPENLTTGRVAQADALLVWVRRARRGESRVDAVGSCADVPGRQATRWWIDPDGTGPNAPFRALCEDGWMLAYKKSTGVARDPQDTWLAGDVGVADPDALSRDRHVGDYANAATTSLWGRFTSARLEVLEGGAPVQVMVFDTAGANNTAWVDLARVRSSTWVDLASQPRNFFSIAGDAGLQRHWYFNRNYGGCPADAGWLIASGDAYACSWETDWAVKYATGTTHANWNDAARIRTADALAVWLK